MLTNEETIRTLYAVAEASSKDTDKFVSLFAEVIANDKPYFIRFDGKSYFPAFVSYSRKFVLL